MHNISTDSLLKKLQNEEINIIDIREDFEVAQGMIESAIHIPMNKIPDYLPEFKVGTPYYIICAHGVRSEHVTQFLRDHDIDAINVLGGMADMPEFKSKQTM